MTKPDKKCPRQDEEIGYNIGELVMVHGIHLGIITMFYAPRGLWVIRLAHDGQELALFKEDFEPFVFKEKDNGNDNDGKTKICTSRRRCSDLP